MPSSPSAPHPKKPPVLGDRYRVVERIGKGGAAGVYLAFDQQLKAWRAAKVLHARHADNAELRGRFLKEARTMARLDHPNVVRVLDVSDGAVPYMVMEYVEGGCILDWMKANGRMPPSMAARILVDVCRGLTATHELGVVHRDVKPHNVLADKRGDCKLTDYGIAKVDALDLGLDVDHDVTQAGATMGTDAFMAPEQRADASAVDHRADLYSVGAMLYTLCTRKTAVDLCMMGIDHPDLEPLPVELRSVVVKACSRLPDERYPSARELEEVLHQVLWRLPSMPVNLPPLVGRVRELPWRPPDTLDPALAADLRELQGSAPADLAAIVGVDAVRTDPDEASEEAPTDLGPATAATPAPTPPPRSAVAEPPPTPAPEAPHQPPAGVSPTDALASEGDDASGFDVAVLVRIGVVVLALSGAAIVGGVGVLWVQGGVTAVAEARSEARAARTALHDALERERSVIEALAAHGADRKRLEDAWFRFSDASGPKRDAEAEAYLAALKAEHQRLRDELSNPAVLGETPMRIQELTSLEAAWNATRATWQDAAGSPAASLAVTLGLAERGEP